MKTTVKVGNLSLSRLVHHGHVAYRFLKLAVREARPDLVVCVYPTIELSWAAVRYGRQAGVAVVLDVRDLWPEFALELVPSPLRPPAKIFAQPYLLMARQAFRGASAILGITENYLRWGLRQAGREGGIRDRIFPLGAEKLNSSKEEISAARIRLSQRGVKPDKKIVWFLGTFGRSYDLRPLVRAARELARQGRQEVQFVLTGTGERLSEWQRLAKGLDNIVFTAWCGVAERVCLMEMASVGLAAYARGATQGLSNKIFEYLSAGIPILSSLNGEAEAFLTQHQCGLTYHPEDESLLRGLIMLIDNEGLRRKMGQNARAVFSERFALEKIYPGMVEYLEEWSGQAEVTQNPCYEACPVL